MASLCSRGREARIRRHRSPVKGAWLTSFRPVEVVRRSVEAAARALRDEKGRVLDRLEGYHRQGGLDATKADDYLAEVAKSRSVWRDGA